MKCLGAAIVAAAFFLAGCGSTRTIIRTEQVKPCASSAAMTKCIHDLDQAAVKARGDIATVKTSCEKQGDHWSCLRFIDYGSGETVCLSSIIRRVGVGVPFLARSEYSADCPWTS